MKSPISDWIFRLAVESTSTGVLVTGPQENDCPILYANPYFRQMTGFSEEEILGKNCRFLHGPGTDPTVVNMIRETLSSENVFRGEILNYRKDGRPFWNQLTIAPVKNLEGGSAPYFVGIQQDISLGKEAILERDELISELKALNMGLSRFASTASHEMKNPLSAIIGFSRLLRDNYFSSLGTEGQLLLERISVNANYLNQCLDQLRIFGTLGHAPISLESTHLSNL
ncbi:MAG: PAS domain-containing protein, partial [Bdellovibrionales bacterium]|nr:PAS domain-containing protein [Bdellovibrionales bacterium]